MLDENIYYSLSTIVGIIIANTFIHVQAENTKGLFIHVQAENTKG